MRRPRRVFRRGGGAL